MFGKLLSQPQMPLQSQREILKEVVSVNLKKNAPEVRLQLNHNYQALKPILVKHPRQSLRIALTLTSWQIALQVLTNKRESPVADLLQSVIVSEPYQSGSYLFNELAKSYSDTWRMLVILKITSEQVTAHLPPKELPSFLAVFVRTSAAVIQAYLNTKNEPTESSKDRIASDLQLVQNCEEWVTQAYVRMLTQLPIPQTRQEAFGTLGAMTQICGALLQNQRGGQLQVQRLKQIEDTALCYSMATMTLHYVGDTYVKQLKARRFVSRLKKIEIPERFGFNTEFAKEGITWILLNFLTDAQGIYTPSYLLPWQLIAFSQSLESPLPIKTNLLKAIKQSVAKGAKLQELDSLYPACLLLFNIWLYNREELDYFKEVIGIGKDPATDLRRFKLLLLMDLGNQNVDKLTFLVSLISPAHLRQKEVLLLAKAIRFDFSQDPLEKQVKQLLCSVVHTHAEGKRVVSQLLQREKDANRNYSLCIQLEKALAL